MTANTTSPLASSYHPPAQWSGSARVATNPSSTRLATCSGIPTDTGPPLVKAGSSSAEALATVRIDIIPAVINAMTAALLDLAIGPPQGT